MEEKYSFSYKLASKWRSFTFNFGWPFYVPYIDGWIPKFAFFFPIIGYLILFNDSISGYFTFHNLADVEILKTGLDGETRLKFLYFGLLFLGVSNFIFRVAKPHVLRLGKDELEYAKAGLEHFTLMNYVNINGRIEREGHVSLDGKIHTDVWEAFKGTAIGSQPHSVMNQSNSNWEEAKQKYGHLLRSMLRDEFYFHSKTKRIRLSICIILSTIGYLFLVIPSADIFIKVLKSIFIT